MERGEIKSILISKVAELCGVDAAMIHEETTYAADLGMKSATMVVLIAFLEGELDVDIDFMLFRKSASIGASVDYLDRLCNE